MPDMGWRWDTVVGMVARRRKVDPALRGKEHPAHWLAEDVWAAPEWLIYRILRGIALLERDGMSRADAMRHVDARMRLNLLAAGADAVSPEEYIVQALRAFAPSYLDRGPALLAKATATARRGLRKLPEGPWWATPNGWPPPEWLWERAPQKQARRSFKTLEREQRCVPVSIYNEEVADLLVRRQRGDQLWVWSSPRCSWRLMMGRGGIALVRKGRVVCRVTTRMN